LPKKVRPRQKPKRHYKEDDGALPTIKEPHDSDYEFVEEEHKDSKTGICSMGFAGLKTMIHNGLNELLGASSLYTYLFYDCP